MTKNTHLSTQDHNNMDKFFNAVLIDYRDGIIDKHNAVSVITHLMAALDQGNITEVRSYLEQMRAAYIKPSRYKG